MSPRLGKIATVLVALLIALASISSATASTARYATTDDLHFSTFLGGIAEDQSPWIAVDRHGSIYIAGATSSPDFPTTSGAFDSTLGEAQCGFSRCNDIFVAKLDPTGSHLIYSTFLGGNLSESSFGIAVDQRGAVYVTGRTSSSDFPTTAGAFDPTLDGTGASFVTKLSPDGTHLIYSTFIEHAISNQLAIDRSGAVYLTGITNSPDFFTTAGAFDTSLNGGMDGFLLKLNQSGSAVVYSTLFGGSGEDYSIDIAVDRSGAAYIAGQTDSLDLPATTGAFSTQFSGNSDIFVAKFDRDGATTPYATYIGGQYDEGANALAVDTHGAAYIAGSSLGDYPTTPGAYDTTYNDNQVDGFPDTTVTKLDPAGAHLVYSTYVGSVGEDYSTDIAVSQKGEAYVTGATLEEFPVTPGAFDTTFNTSRDVDGYAFRLNAQGSVLQYSTYVGGDETTDTGWTIALDRHETVYIAGNTMSTDFPTTTGAFDPSYNGGNSDVFVIKLSMDT